MRKDTSKYGLHGLEMNDYSQHNGGKEYKDRVGKNDF